MRRAPPPRRPVGPCAELRRAADPARSGAVSRLAALLIRGPVMMTAGPHRPVRLPVRRRTALSDYR